MEKISKKKFLKGLGMLAVVGIVSTVFKRTHLWVDKSDEVKYPRLARKEPRAVSRGAFRI